MIRSKEELCLIFNSGGHWVKKAGGEIAGKGHFEADLIVLGFTKPELKKMVDQGVLLKCQVRDVPQDKNMPHAPIRNTYILPMQPPDEPLAEYRKRIDPKID